MNYKKETIKITIETIDNGYVTTISNEYGMLIASWYDVLKGDVLRKIGDQLGGITPGEIDDPHPYTKSLEERELTEVETDSLNKEMEAIREEHLKILEDKNDKEETNTEESTENKDRKA